MEDLIKRLSRYSEQCIAERLDPDFAEAVTDAITTVKMAGEMNGLNYVLILSERERAEHFKKAYHDEVDAKAEAIQRLRKRGKWIPVSTYVCKCSNCDDCYIMRADAEDNYFCYKCGADMRMDGE